MKIKYTQFALNPALRGTTAHLPLHRALALIDSGAAIEVPMAPRGTAQWLQDMKERSAAANPPVYATVTWAVAQGAVNGRIYISAKCSQPCTTFAFDGHPDSLVFPDTRQYMSLEHLVFTHSCGCGVHGPETIPAAICEQYRKLYKPRRVYGHDEALAAKLAAPQKSELLDRSKFAGPAAGEPLLEGCEKEHLLNYLPNPGDGQPVDMSKVVFPWKS